MVETSDSYQVMKYARTFLKVFLVCSPLLSFSQNFIDISVEMVEKLKQGQSVSGLQQQLANADESRLLDALDSDDKKLAFWVNVYNANIIAMLSENPERYNNRGDFFGEQRITIAGKKLSFDDIEHGILRRSQVKLGLGFLGKWFVDDFEEKFRVDQVDPRIHFALNCGARSCPPVTAYEASTIDEQLDKQTHNFLQKNTTYDPNAGEATVTSLLSWFRGDFSAAGGVIAFLKKYEIIPKNSDPDLSYDNYDWTLDINNFAN